MSGVEQHFYLVPVSDAQAQVRELERYFHSWRRFKSFYPLWGFNRDRIGPGRSEANLPHSISQHFPVHDVALRIHGQVLPIQLPCP